MSKLFTSEKNIMSIEEFMENYIGKQYDGDEKLTHNNMSMYLYEKGLGSVSRVRFDVITKSDILKGKYVLVKDQNHQVLAYKNPMQHSLDNLFFEMQHSSKKKLEEIRNAILSDLGYTHDENGEVVDKEELKQQQYEDSLRVTAKVNRQRYVYKRQYY